MSANITAFLAFKQVAHAGDMREEPVKMRAISPGGRQRGGMRQKMNDENSVIVGGEDDHEVKNPV